MKKELTSADLIRICNRYLSNDFITFNDIAKEEGVSRSTLSRKIHQGIVSGDISIEIAQKLMYKADRNANNKMQQMNKSYGTTAVRKKYAKSIDEAIERKNLLIAMNDLDNEIDDLENKISQFDDFCSSEDELYISKECLENQLKQKQKIMEGYKKMLNDIELER